MAKGYIDYLEEERNKAFKQAGEKIDKLKEAVKSARWLLEKCSDERIKILSRACLDHLVGEEPEQGSQVLAYEMTTMRLGKYDFYAEVIEKFGKHTDMAEHITILIDNFDVMDYIFSNTHYDSYSNGHFFRMS